MAKNEQYANETLCKYCRKNIVKSIKCEKCYSPYLQSCAQRLRGVKISSETAVICCENGDLEGSSDNNQTYSTEVENTQANNRVPITNESTKIKISYVIFNEAIELVEEEEYLGYLADIEVGILNIRIVRR
ncbi:hypothetical protein WA026_015977 [Henosepilachna vigintioctopunctata]|uniref:Uncharacterized protein n=1 Tax=Henosepilachna vigintioctopunctata TaxID=420089 RepID=A0AAW1U7B8_9CUCU